MSLNRFVRLLRKPKKDISKNDRVVFTQIARNGVVPIQLPLNTSQVGVYVLPDITGQIQSVHPVGQKILEHSNDKIECDLVVMSDRPIDNQLQDLPVKSDAGYIRYGKKLYYLNKINDELEDVPVKDIDRFDAEMKISTLAKNTPRTLTDEELKQITTITNHTHENKRQVAVYQDDDIKLGLYQDGLKIENEAKDIAKAMQTKLPNGPFVIVAYSYSSLIAIEIMQYLQYFTNKNSDVFVYIIDAPTPELSKEFLNKKSDEYIQSLVDIVNYTATVCCGIRPALPPLNQNQVEELKKYAPDECLEQIAQMVYKRQRTSDEFKNIIDFEKMRLRKMANYDKEFVKPLKGTIEVLITDKTAEKYGDKFGGWKGYATSVNFVTDERLRSLNHQSIVQEENAELLAQSINSFINAKITPQYLFANSIITSLLQNIQLTQRAGDQELIEAIRPYQQIVLKKYSPSTTPPEPELKGAISPPEIASPGCNTPVTARVHLADSTSTTAIFSAMNAIPGRTSSPGNSPPRPASPNQELAEAAAPLSSGGNRCRM